MSLLCRLLILPMLLSTFNIAFATNATTSEIDFKDIKETYVAAAFPSGNTQLRKFQNVTPLTYNWGCEAYNRNKCINALQHVSAAISTNASFQLLQTKGKAEFQIVLASKSRLNVLKNSLQQDFKNDTFDNASNDCQLYIRNAGARIEHAVVVVSLDSSVLRIETCLLVNLYRSLGLSLNDGVSFSEGWGTVEKLGKEYSRADFVDLKKRIDLLVYVHSCKQLVAGMSKADVMKELNQHSSCLQELRRDTNGG
jgi:hypothetical protein